MIDADRPIVVGGTLVQQRAYVRRHQLYRPIFCCDERSYAGRSLAGRHVHVAGVVSAPAAKLIGRALMMWGPPGLVTSDDVASGNSSWVHWVEGWTVAGKTLACGADWVTGPIHSEQLQFVTCPPCVMAACVAAARARR